MLILAYTLRCARSLKPISIGETCRILATIIFLGDCGFYFGHQEHFRRSLYRVKGLHDSQVVGCQYGSETSEDYQCSRTSATTGRSDIRVSFAAPSMIAVRRNESLPRAHPIQFKRTMSCHETFMGEEQNALSYSTSHPPKYYPGHVVYFDLFCVSWVVHVRLIAVRSRQSNACTYPPVNEHPS